MTLTDRLMFWPLVLRPYAGPGIWNEPSGPFPLPPLPFAPMSWHVFLASRPIEEFVQSEVAVSPPDSVSVPE